MKKNNSSTEEQHSLTDKNGNKIEINPTDEVDKNTLKQYRIHWYQKIPYPVRALFIKYWFFGLNYFLFDVGLGYLDFFQSSSGDIFAYATLILMLISGLALGVFNDLFVYNILDIIEDFPNEKEHYVIFKSKKLYSLFINILYGLLVGFISRLICGNLTRLIDPTLHTFLFREPFTCALMMFVIDALFITIKNAFVSLFRNVLNKGN